MFESINDKWALHKDPVKDYQQLNNKVMREEA